MAETAVRGNTAVAGEKQQALSGNRRYVGTRETVAYVAYDVAQSFNVSKYADIFITDIVQISLSFQTLVTFVIGIWDVINDIFLAAIVDKTRTRFGKFRPW
ncbi:MAG: MFS transporter, partial [Clostridia bacterium]|nr:MFS transporter [Clostridia bacterium]